MVRYKNTLDVYNAYQFTDASFSSSSFIAETETWPEWVRVMWDQDPLIPFIDYREDDSGSYPIQLVTRSGLTDINEGDWLLADPEFTPITVLSDSQFKALFVGIEDELAATMGKAIAAYGDALRYPNMDPCPPIRTR